jgi:hypothetical protein
MIAEVSPLPQMYAPRNAACALGYVADRAAGNRFLFFALFSVVGKTSAFVGPFVSSAIIDAADGNANMPFAFLFGLCVVCARFHMRRGAC